MKTIKFIAAALLLFAVFFLAGMPLNANASNQHVATPTPTPQTYGPNTFPGGVNPLTGLPVDNPELLKIPAVLVSISHYPVSARPQAGLSYTPLVFEIYISEGMTRFLAVFYGEYPEAGDTTGELNQSAPEVGPVRSGRLPYVYIRDFFHNSCLVYASATEELRAKLRGCKIVYGNDSNDINSALIDVTKMQQIAEANNNGKPFNYTGNLFSTEIPTGSSANTLNVFYSLKNQTQWRYDPASGAYLRYHDNAEGKGNFYPATDRLTGEQLKFENIIVLIAPHTTVKPTIIDIDLSMGNMGKAFIFRDGVMAPIYWTTLNGEYEKTSGLRRPIRFVDANGNPIALKPGHTWVHVMSQWSFVEEKEAGVWRARFIAPKGSK
jgi:hypothetical protein